MEHTRTVNLPVSSPTAASTHSTYEQRPLFLKCGHTFEEAALEKWILENLSVCPTCKTFTAPKEWILDHALSDYLNPSAKEDESRWNEDKILFKTFEYPKILDCGHSFETTAIAEWIEKSTEPKPTCPICRTPIKENLSALKDNAALKRAITGNFSFSILTPLSASEKQTLLWETKKQQLKTFFTSLTEWYQKCSNYVKKHAPEILFLPLIVMSIGIFFFLLVKTSIEAPIGIILLVAYGLFMLATK